MKEKPTLQQKLAKRKFKITNRFFYWIYYFIMIKLVAPKYKPTYTVIDDINKCDGPCFLIWNHLSRLDHLYVMKLAYPRRINIMGGYNEFFRSHLHLVFKLNNIIPKKNYTAETASMKATISILNQGGCVAFAPEGMSSIYGTNQPIVAGTGSMLKHFRYPVYYAEMRGQYLTSTKMCLDERQGRTEATLRLLYSPEDLAAKTSEQIDNEINALFRHDDYAWSREQGLHWKNNGQMASQLETMLYRCPRCGAEMQMETSGSRIRCAACGNGADIDDTYAFVPFDETCVLPESPSKWVEQERVQIIKEIRENPDYSYTIPCKLGYLPPYEYVKKPATSKVCGEGTFTIDHKGVHYNGTKLGEPFSFDMGYEKVFSLIITTDTTNFALYPHGEYHEILPLDPVVGKCLLLTEEMHRLHVNTWKNFEWNDWMYQ